MNIFIARDGAIIGEYPREKLDEMAGAGELHQDDHYWQEGMENWLPLPQLLTPNAREAYVDGPTQILPQNLPAIVGGVATLLTVIALIGFLLVKPDRGMNRVIPVWPSAVPPLSAAQVKEEASADLKQKIERLPARALPPLNTFYYGFSVHMNTTFEPRTPWSATIRGKENVIDAASQQTLWQTDLVLTADYHDRQWVFKSYRANVTNMADGTSTEISEDENSMTPPAIVGMLGFKKGSDSAQTSIEIP